MVCRLAAIKNSAESDPALSLCKGGIFHFDTHGYIGEILPAVLSVSFARSQSSGPASGEERRI